MDRKSLSRSLDALFTKLYWLLDEGLSQVEAGTPEWDNLKELEALIVKKDRDRLNRY